MYKIVLANITESLINIKVLFVQNFITPEDKYYNYNLLNPKVNKRYNPVKAKAIWINNINFGYFFPDNVVAIIPPPKKNANNRKKNPVTGTSPF